MIFRGRKGAPRRFIALGVALAVQVWSLAPVAASVIYCIGEDGHSGFELVRAGARGCGACCHEPAGGGAQQMRGALRANGAPHANGAPLVSGAPLSECTDIAMAPAAGLVGKVSGIASAVPLATDGWLIGRVLRVNSRPREISFDPPRSSAARMLRRTVLLI